MYIEIHISIFSCPKLIKIILGQCLDKHEAQLQSERALSAYTTVLSSDTKHKFREFLGTIHKFMNSLERLTEPTESCCS